MAFPADLAAQAEGALLEREIPSGSMRPSLLPGEAIRFRRRAERLPRRGEVWVARLGSQHVVHRVIAVQGERVLLKGDANRLPDGWIDRAALYGPVEARRRDGRWEPWPGLLDEWVGWLESRRPKLGLGRLIRRLRR